MAFSKVRWGWGLVGLAAGFLGGFAGRAEAQKEARRGVQAVERRAPGPGGAALWARGGRSVQPQVVPQGGDEVLLVLDISGTESWDLAGDPDNEVLEVPLGAGAVVTGVGWDVTLTAIGASWLSEASIALETSDAAASGIVLTPGAEDDFPGTASYSSGGVLDLTALGFEDLPIPSDGTLFLEFFESFDDVANAVDGTWDDPSTLTFRVRAPRCTMARLGSTMVAGFAQEVAVTGDLALVAAFDAGLEVVDLTDPVAPTVVGSLALPGLTMGVAAQGNLAFCVSQLAPSGSQFSAIDVTNPGAPLLLGSTTTAGEGFDIALAAAGAFVADGTAGVALIGITDPANPTVLAELDTPGLAVAVATSGNLAYVADYNAGLQVIDAPGAVPAIVGELATPGLATGVALLGSAVLLSDATSGLTSIDVSNPALPMVLDTEPVPGFADDVVVAGSRAFVAARTAGVHAIDASVPADLVPLGTLDTPSSASALAPAAGDRLAVADFQSGLQVLGTGLCQPLFNDECIQAFPLECNTTVIADNTLATTAPDDPPLSCIFGGPGPGVNTIWYRFIAEGPTVRVHTEGSLPPADDSLLAVYAGPCGALVELGCSEDDGSGLLSDLTVTGLTPGESYYVQLSSFSVSDVGPYMLTLECPTDTSVFPYNGSGINQDLLEATEVVIGQPWSATLTPQAGRGPGPWILQLRPNDAAGPTVDLGLTLGLPAAGLSERLVSGTAIADFAPPMHAGGGTPTTFTLTVPNTPALVGSPWFIQAVVFGDLPSGAGTLDPWFSSAVGGTVQPN